MSVASGRSVRSSELASSVSDHLWAVGEELGSS